MKRICSVLLILCLLPGVLSGALGGGAGQKAQAAAVGAKSGILSIPDPTQDELRAVYAQYQKPTQRFAVAPSVKAPYATGAVDANYLQQALNYLNFYRAAAKLQPIQASAAKNELAQHGAVLLAVLNQLVHDPADSMRPADMEQAFFQTGKLATAISTISSFSFREYVQAFGWEQANLYKIREMIPYVLMFQIRDNDRGNFQCLGHRRYLLSPYLKDCGFGVADSADGYGLFFVVDHSLSKWPEAELVQNPDYDFVAWPPSGNCPSQLMEKTFPWSICLNEDRYLVPAVKDSSGKDSSVGDRSGIVIRVTRQSDGRVWSFDENSPDGSAVSNPQSYSEPYFYIDKRSRGFGPLREEWISDTTKSVSFASSAIIFRPDFEDGEAFTGVYEVRVTGLKTAEGSPTELNYQVNFFDITPCEHEWSQWAVSREPSCSEEGVQSRSCALCGSVESQSLPALGHDWDEGVVTKEPGPQETGERLYTCRRCGETRTETIPRLSNPFVDVSEGKYYYSAVLWAYYHQPQITGGADSTHFAPNKECKREQVVSFLYAAQGKPEFEMPENPFRDVKPSKYYYKAVMWALANEVTGGVSQDQFGVGRSCTREQVVTFLWKLAGKPESGQTENPFTDVKPGKYYYKAVLWALEHKITGGASETRFGVGKACTRGQIVTFLYKAAQE